LATDYQASWIFDAEEVDQEDEEEEEDDDDDEVREDLVNTSLSIINIQKLRT
jgi:hypothetical protein